jgi:peptide/nickel transport system substrate-binding protein
MVRNPNYDSATDTKEMRENLPDGFLYTLNTNQKDIFNKIEAGELEGEVGSGSLPDVLRKYVTQDELKDRLKINSADRTWYIYLNLTIPPFDDLHVRKAASFVMDKTGLQRAWGGETSGVVATHIVPNAMFGGDLADFDPYPSPDHAGDVEAAKAEMKQSKYDTNQDGLCDAEACKGVLHVTRNYSPWSDMVPVIEDSLKKIGITLTTRELKDQYPVVQTVSKSVATGSGVGWGKDYADASTFISQLLDGRLIIATGNTNYALIGLTPEKAKEVNAKGNIENVPSIDDGIDRCQALLDDERLSCWEELDKGTMEDIVPWIPYLDANALDFLGPAVTTFVFDQYAGTPAWAHLAVDPSLQK